MPIVREPVSKKTRFKVFKRDAFTCQYCGAHPPTTILEIDHIDPVSNGGDNGIDNLITACFECNRGKGSENLAELSPPWDDDFCPRCWAKIENLETDIAYLEYVIEDMDISAFKKERMEEDYQVVDRNDGKNQ